MSAQPLITADDDPTRPAGLDGARALIEAGRVHEGMQLLAEELAAQRARRSPADWRDWIRTHVAVHPVRSLVREDPLTARAADRPRGYPGDPVTMDLVYGLGAPEPASARGAAIHRFTTNGRAARAVRHRRQLLARHIDDAAGARPGARVLVLAAGHLREAELSGALRQGRVGELVAVDHDAQSLARVARDYGGLGVRTLHASVRAIVSGRLALGGFDLVYAAGLFERLGERSARRLAEAMFDRVRPGGRVLVSNFLPDVPDAGYLEAMMVWPLVSRGEADLLSLASGIPRRRISELTLSFDDDENIGYLAIERKRAPSVATLAAVDPRA